jgi:hypothetical protein
MNHKLNLTILLLFYTLICSSQTKEDIKVELNTPLIAEIGTSLVTAGKIIKTEAVEVMIPFEFKNGFFKFRFVQGDIYPLVKTSKGYKIFYLTSNLKDGRYWGIAINEKNGDEVYSALISSFGFVQIRKKDNYMSNIKMTVIKSLCEGCISQELLFTGAKGAVLSFTYREFIGNIARPSFFQNVNYDIEESNVIGFKGVRLKILEYTNTSIKYEILRTFDPLN